MTSSITKSARAGILTLALAMVPAIPALAQNASRDSHGARTSVSDPYMSHAGTNHSVNHHAANNGMTDTANGNQASKGASATHTADAATLGAEPNGNGGTAGVNSGMTNANHTGYNNGDYYGGGGWGLWGLVGLIGLIGLVRAGARR